MMEFVFDGIEKVLGKKKILVTIISPFPTKFSKKLSPKGP